MFAEKKLLLCNYFSFFEAISGGKSSEECLALTVSKYEREKLKKIIGPVELETRVEVVGVSGVVGG